MAQYAHFIKENVAPKGAKRIGIYDVNGNRVGQIPLGDMAVPKGKRLYSFGVVADSHVKLPDSNTTAYFRTALERLGANKDVAFICVLGDVVDAPTPEMWTVYQGLIDQHTIKHPQKPVYHITGNHECTREVLDGPYRELVALRDENGNVVLDENGEIKQNPDLLFDENILKQADEFIASYGGQPRPYTFEYNGDLFIMLSLHRYYTGNEAIYFKDDVLRIYETIQQNTDKRIFVMSHCPITSEEDFSPDTYQRDGVFSLPMFRDINCVVFYGHVHGIFSAQKNEPTATYSEKLGVKTVRTPMVSATTASKAEGYIVDVYENGIHLRGCDFKKGEDVPIGTYWLDVKKG